MTGYPVIGPLVHALSHSLVLALDVDVEQVASELQGLLAESAPAVVDLLHVGSAEDGEAASAVSVELFELPGLVLPVHRGQLQPTCARCHSEELQS